VPPGKCQFTAEFTSCKLLEKKSVSETSSVLRFELPDTSKALNLSTCACILARLELKKANEELEQVIRPYTPISTNELIGSFDLLVKHYPNSKMSGHMYEMNVNDTLDFKHIDFNVKIQAPFKPCTRIGMIVGGTGITPMIQALHAILGSGGEETPIKVDMLYGSRTSDDILGKELLDKWAKENKDLFSVTHVLSNEPEESKWDEGERGFITKELIESSFGPPSEGEKVKIFVCGPPPMYDVFCGPRTETDLTGVLKDIGYDASQVYKF